MARRPILVEARYRSDLERKVADQLDGAGVPYDFEGQWVRYTVPAREAKYLPDFTIRGTDIIIEAKGRFGGHKSDASGAQERQKMILLKEQHPDKRFVIVFQNAKKPIYKGSKTTYAKWATDHGFEWSDRGVVPASLINELKKTSTK
uniref:Endonuclease I n=1 Tax=Rhodopseudomonas palustris (strain DX-1) TaxID=652103 RepID=E6VL74_RHOPX